MSYTVTDLYALEILDSRAKPALGVYLELDGHIRASAGVPSGASTGSREAVELRDGNPERFAGNGLKKAVSNVNEELYKLVVGHSWNSLDEIDSALIEADGTENKSRLGANAILGVSMAFARAASHSDGKELWQWLPGVEGQERRLPLPCFNVLNGGVHSPNPLDFQEFMLCPLGAEDFPAALRAGAEIYWELKKILSSQGQSTGLGDEGGFAPNVSTPEEVCSLLVEAINQAGYPIGSDGIMIALDPAASEFYSDGTYSVAGEQLNSEDLIHRYQELVESYPIWSIEDPMAEDDTAGWKLFTEALSDRIQIVGDDNFCTNPTIISDAIDNKIANASLIKLNQIGTITEALEAMRLCHSADYAQMVSHRSGETPDPFIADFVVASGAGQLKSGAPARGERIAKYNRLVEISARNPELPFGL